MEQSSQLPYRAPLRSADLEQTSLAGRKYLANDPAGYALQTLESFLLEYKQGRRLFFAAPELAILELAPQIAKLPYEGTRRQIVLELMKPARSNDGYRNYIATKIPHLIYFLSLRERMRLLSHVLTWPERKASAAMAYGIVRSAKTKDEMFELVTEKRSKQLLKLKHKELREIVAKVLFMRRFKELSLPLGLSRKISARVVKEPKKARQAVRERLSALYDSVKAHLAAVESYRRLERTRSAKEFTRSLKDALRILSPHVGRNGALPKQPLSRFEGAKLAALVSLKVRSELAHGVWFARSRPSKGKPSWSWTISDVKRVLPALKEIGEGVRLMTPLLHRFERQSDRKDEFGSRAPNGAIQLTDSGRSNRSISRAFGGRCYSLITILHEIGHAIQIGASAESITYAKHTGRVLSPADAIFDFQAFCALSGWRFVTEQPWSLVFGGHAVDVAGTMYPVDRTTTYQGEPAVFVDIKEGTEKYLLVRHPDAQFGVRFSASYEPWEDWAEGFSEYLLAPDRFVVFAPEKFLYFQVHFRRYEESSDIIQSLHERLGGTVTS
jgi:hypothetical protein